MQTFPSFAFYFSIVTCWALQVQFLLQIIVNRCAILIPDRQMVTRLKLCIAIFITAVNISVYIIWVPTRLQISERFIWINDRWDRIEKGIYLCVDCALNCYFIRKMLQHTTTTKYYYALHSVTITDSIVKVIVKRSLISNGLAKYKRLTDFNIFIICFSLSMDILIISTMSLNNSFV